MTHSRTRLPGDLAIWFFIYAELAVFGLLFILYAAVRYQNPEVFSVGQLSLSKIAGLTNTIALITSSYFVVRAVEAIKNGLSRNCGRWLIAALIAASIYILVKTTEYQHLINAGYGLTTNKFYTYYFLLTFFHFAHVILGMVILSAVYFKNYQGGYSEKQHTGIETGASYWHMVDLVWVILFPLVYIIH